MKLHRRLITCLMVLLAFSVMGQEEEGEKLPEDSIVAPEVALYKQGVKLVDSAKYKESLPVFKKAIKLKPDYVEAYVKSAYAKFKLNFPRPAEKDLKAALKIDPTNFDALRLMGNICFEDANYKDCKMYYDSAANQGVINAEFCYERAKLMFVGKDYKGVLEMAAAGINLKPNYIDAMILKGRARLELKDFNYAVKEFNEAVKVMPADKIDYIVYELRAKARFEIQDYKGSIADWNVVIDAFPKDEEALISRGSAKINANDFSGAIVDLDEAIKINGNNPVSYNYRGAAKGGNKQLVEAMKDIEYAIKLKFDYPSAYVNRAAIKFARKDKRGACEDLNKADSLGDTMAYKLYDQYCK